MNKSMTGYGLEKYIDEGVEISVEIKTINSKFLDCVLLLPKFLSSKEIEIRKMLSEMLERGKVVISIKYENKQTPIAKVEHNKSLFLKYYKQVKELMDEVGGQKEGLAQIVLQYPDVTDIVQDTNQLGEKWGNVREAIINAIKKCDEHRIEEGAAMTQGISTYIQEIKNNIAVIEQYETERIETIKDRIYQSLSKAKIEEINRDRFEQELIYYLEKLDITEEKLRLSNHLEYFMKILNSPNSEGKKLTFISQEIGREINTLGSKANHAQIQKIVVNMKEQLEKVKEQMSNIL